MLTIFFARDCGPWWTVEEEDEERDEEVEAWLEVQSKASQSTGNWSTGYVRPEVLAPQLKEQEDKKAPIFTHRCLICKEEVKSDKSWEHLRTTVGNHNWQRHRKENQRRSNNIKTRRVAPRRKEKLWAQRTQG